MAHAFSLNCTEPRGNTKKLTSGKRANFFVFHVKHCSGMSEEMERSEESSLFAQTLWSVGVVSSVVGCDVYSLVLSTVRVQNKSVNGERCLFHFALWQNDKLANKQPTELLTEP